MYELLDFFSRAGFWPWLLILISLLAFLGYRFSKISFPGGGGIEFLTSSRAPVDQYDLELRKSSANIAWSTHINHSTNSIVPSSVLWVKPLPGLDAGIVTNFGQSIYQQFCVANAVREAIEIGRMGKTRRYEITPQVDGGVETHYVEITPVAGVVGTTLHNTLGNRQVRIDYKDSSGRTFHSYSFFAEWDTKFRTWRSTTR